MLIDGVGASSADGAVPRSYLTRSQEVFRRKLQRALLEARLEQEQPAKIRSDTEGKDDSRRQV
jgi:hypothetical protein